MRQVRTLGPQRACLVTQQISVRQTEHRTQSQPHRFISITWHCGQDRASPLATKAYQMKSIN